MKGKLKRLENAEGMNDDVVNGEFWTWPKIGGSFRFFKFSNGKMRIIETAHVTRITQYGDREMVFEVKDGLFQITITGE